MEKIDDETWTQVLTQYFSEKNWELKPVPGGLNNLTRFVNTPNETFVVRIYQNGYGIEKVKYEIETLRRLHSILFSFQTPKVFLSLKGEDFVVTPNGNQAVMFTLISGHLPDETNLKHIKEFGRAAGELTTGWKDLKIDMPCPTFPYYELYKIHPLVPNKETLQKSITSPVFDKMREQADFLYEEIMKLEGAFESYHKILPKQNLHGDLWMGNCLIENDKITAILDFEFASIDWRALEVAICVARFALAENPWECFEAFLQGFSQTCSLLEEEIQAIPALIKLRTLTNVIHFIGRYIEGLDSEEDVTKRLQNYFKRIGWINDNEGKIVDIFKTYLLNKEKQNEKSL